MKLRRSLEGRHPFSLPGLLIVGCTLVAAVALGWLAWRVTLLGTAVGQLQAQRNVAVAVADEANERLQQNDLEPVQVPTQARAAVDGVDGRDGQDGTDGLDGLDGLPGRDGLTIVGAPGQNGRDGRDSTVPGPTGAPGAPGSAGVGIDGQNGRDGRDGTPGADSTVPGPPGPQGLQGVAGAPGNPPEGWLASNADGSTTSCVRADGFDPAAPRYVCTTSGAPAPEPAPAPETSAPETNGETP